jgi:hypothetical protein
MQLYSIPITNNEPTQLTNTMVNIDDYKLSPDNTQIALTLTVFPEYKTNLDYTKRKLDKIEVCFVLWEYC